MTSSQYWRQSGGYDSDQSSDTALEDDNAVVRRSPDSSMPAMWQLQRQQSGPAMTSANKKIGSEISENISVESSSLKKQYRNRQDHVDHSIDDDAASRSSTLGGDEEGLVYTEKMAKSVSAVTIDPADSEPTSPVPAPHIPGPLESQLASLMSKLIYLEHMNPAISVQPKEYQEMQVRLKALEEEKKSWWKRHEAIWALRDEDVENNIKIRVSCPAGFFIS